MAIAPGYQGKVRFYKDSQDNAAALETYDTTIWALEMQRPMVDVTPIESDAHQFVPDAGVAAITIRGFIDQDLNPGIFNQLLATIEVMTDQRSGGAALNPDSGKKETFQGWVERIRWISSVDGANMFEAVIRASGDLTHSWN